ncbi:lipocalin-like domain-containing protein [Novosphingobium sp. Chol11]|uniref:lipocalin-like domain-containing protein n=1 Tax=Novosphingobium sp. Chol11 TaxID=1385763 RepID=UPI0025F8B0BB|nr:lipocalin-like domain-containing protein [Novosphingobium sp. Chol11]
MKRAHAIMALALMAATSAAPPVVYPVVSPGRTFAFPADHGAHPEYRTEWWYVTGIVAGVDGKRLGFQVTFFRSRLPVDPNNASAFAAKQVLFAHVALSDPATGHILHDERAARAGFGLAGAKVGDADITIRDWRLVRLADGQFTTRIAAKGFTLDLAFTPSQPPLLEGQGGYSRKGPKPSEASYYYSLPQMRVSGTIMRGKAGGSVSGKAWLDREWSSSYLNPVAAGWDWTGLNFDDGSALMAFRIRRRDGSTLWAGGSFRRAGGAVVVLAPGDVSLVPMRRWTSPRTGATYPIAQTLTIRLPEGVRRFALTPFMADQELDARRSGLPIYWEGAVTTPGGSGYLELTGYAAPMKM